MSVQAVIFSAPSGSGKTTIVKNQLQRFKRLTFSISATTRAPRASEVDGVDYHFYTYEEFTAKKANGEFIETEEVYPGLYYGTLKSEVDRIWESGRVVVFDVDVVGGKNLKDYFGAKAISIFVKPPSLKSLRERLESRGTETEESLMERISKATHELTYESYFDHSVINDDLDVAIREVQTILEPLLR